jgi:hypothetical protein
MTEDDKPAPPASDSRESKLAQALRANLRRRKVTGAPAVDKTPKSDKRL